MNLFGNSKGANRRSGILGLFEDDFENESSMSSTASTVVSAVTEGLSQAASEVFKAASDLGQDVKGAESQAESSATGKFPATGSIEFNKKQAQNDQKEKIEIGRKKVFFQTLTQDRERAQRAKDKLLFEEEINDIVTNLPTDQKNQLLHYQASYKDRSIYQRSELRKKIIEESKKAEQKEQQESISPKSQGSFKMGENELGKGGENFGHFTRATG